MFRNVSTPDDNQPIFPTLPAHGTRCHSSLRAAPEDPEGAHSRGTKRRHRSTYLVRVRVRVRVRAGARVGDRVRRAGARPGPR